MVSERQPRDTAATRPARATTHPGLVRESRRRPAVATNRTAPPASSVNLASSANTAALGRIRVWTIGERTLGCVPKLAETKFLKPSAKLGSRYLLRPPSKNSRPRIACAMAAAPNTGLRPTSTLTALVATAHSFARVHYGVDPQGEVDVTAAA